MDANFFQYNTAIQQITQQEQGEAIDMLSVFQGCWYKENYILLWDWIGCTQIIFSIIILAFGIIVWLMNLTN